VKYLCALTVGALMSILMACSPDPVGRADYCSIGEARTTLLLVDRTTSYDQLDREIFAAELERLYTTLEPGERMLVQTITEDYAGTERSFDECLPGCAPGTSGLLGTCDRFTIEEANTQFEQRLRTAVRGLIETSPDRPRSEIIMTIATTTQQQHSSGLRRLFVFSDLLENSPTTYPWPTIASQTPDDVAARARALNAVPALSGVDVAVFGFGRDHTDLRRSLDPVVRDRMIQVWTRYLNEGDASSIRIDQRTN
jgi:hypothetical protein